MFRTDCGYLKKGLTSGDTHISRLCGENGYPFLALADPDGTAASIFNIEHKNFIRQILENVSNHPQLARYHKTCNLIPVSSFRESFFNNVGGANTLLPSELLIDENGVLVDIMRAEKSIESMMMGRITQSLLFGTKQSDVQGEKK